MAHPESFYHHIYDWQDMPRDSLLSTLLKSCHRIMNTCRIADVCALIDHLILQLRLDGYYRLEVSSHVYIEHFQGGRQVSYDGLRPQKGSENRTIKVVELERAIIFKMHFIQLYLFKHQENAELLENNKDACLLWLMHIESVCLQASLKDLPGQSLTAEQRSHADSMNFHIDLEINASRLTHQASQMYQTFNERVMSLLTPAEYIQPAKYQQLLINAVTLHQEQLSELIKKQYGLFSSSKRVLEAITHVS